MTDIKKLLDVSDMTLLNETAGVSWVPANPREVLLPYMSDAPNREEKSDIDRRREKAKEVVDGYTKVVNQCKLVEAQIEERCKNVIVPINRAQHLSVMQALARIFGLGEQEEITFEMYKICVRELAKISNDTGAPIS